MQIIKRIKRMYQLSKKEPEALKKLENLTDEQLDFIPDEGDGNAIFIGEGTQEEFKEMIEEDKGFKNLFGKGL